VDVENGPIVFDSLSLGGFGNQRQKGVIDRAKVPHIHVPEGIKSSHDVSPDNFPCYLEETPSEPVWP
jgi:hypothetical protein